MRPVDLSRDEAERLVDLLEADAGLESPHVQAPAVSESDWRLLLAEELRRAWGMAARPIALPSPRA